MTTVAVSEFTVSAVLTASAITITKHDLMRDWAAGIISDLAYIHYALKMERVNINEPFEVECFIERWESPKIDTDKMKSLKVSTVLSCLGKLEQKEAIELSTQLQIGLF